MENLRGFHYQYSGNNYTESDQQYSSMAPPPAAPTRVTLVRSESSSSDAAFLEDNNKDEDDDVSQVLRARVASHPLFSQLLHAYIDCHKLGAPPEMVQLLDGIIGSGVCLTPAASLGADPELDHFMETYCNLLVKYKSDLSRPFGEATAFLNHMETQLNSICNHPTAPNNTPHQTDETGSSEKDFSKEEKEAIESKRINEDHQELKDNLLRRYSGYISNLKHEVSKNKKKEKLPKEAKQILLTWWDIHFKWPYPTDADKVALAEWTGLDQKQVNNWFINQRKRHWKPTNEMQAAILDGLYGPLHELE